MRSPDRRPQALPDRLALLALPLPDQLPATMTAGILVVGGLLLVVSAIFPIAVSDWLPRSIQLLIGAIAIVGGAVLIELRDLALTFLHSHAQEGPDDEHEEAGPEGPAPVKLHPASTAHPARDA